MKNKLLYFIFMILLASSCFTHGMELVQEQEKKEQEIVSPREVRLMRALESEQEKINFWKKQSNRYEKKFKNIEDKMSDIELEKFQVESLLKKVEQKNRDLEFGLQTEREAREVRQMFEPQEFEDEEIKEPGESCLSMCCKLPLKLITYGMLSTGLFMWGYYCGYQCMC